MFWFKKKNYSWRIEYQDDAGDWQDTTRRHLGGQPFATKGEATPQMEAMANHHPEVKFRVAKIADPS